MRLQYLFYICAIFFTLTAAVSLSNAETTEEKSTYFQVIEEPYSVSGVSLSLYEAQSESLKMYQGRYILLNLWATWCAPCLEELPSFDRLRVKYKDDPRIEIMAVNIERGQRENVVEFMHQHNITSLKSYTDETRALQKTLKFEALPTTFLIDPDGNAVAFYAGTLEWDIDEKLNSELASYLNEVMNSDIQELKNKANPERGGESEDMQPQGILEPSHIQEMYSMEVEIML